MNEYSTFPFIVMPIVLLLGYGAVRLHEWDLDRRPKGRGFV